MHLLVDAMWKQIVNDTKAVQVATLESLKAQGEQMKRIHGNIQNVEDGVDEAEVVLDSMVCCGCFGGKAKARSKAKRTARAFAQTNGSLNSRKPVDNSHKGDNKEMRLYGPKPGTLGAAENGAYADEYGVIQEHREKQDNYLDQISEALDVIKDGAKEMGGEVDNQNKMMDGLENGTVNAQKRVADAQGHKVIRKHAKGLGRRMK
ncbi:unnamed protein product [Ostreobium quekettii]|uniref:t-SNARE coiled-coil homology domain-containing protein n=1 Tax=Ostreobium quekettii TaxID=121088 RepID=A0A8S1IXE7_9CHLO|nr:unnamed protein product [Ostreobium quekettii]